MKKGHDSFFSSVYQVVELIPAGRVTSYGAIGKYLGMKSSARMVRMVGWAMNTAHTSACTCAPCGKQFRLINRQASF